MRITPLLITLLVVLATVVSTASAQPLPAFPGAEGAGSMATGGRGMEVYHVTNLNESGPGSFVDALSQSNRIVVFEVSGVIALNTPDPASGRNDHFFRVGRSNITIAGQTAPGNGIVIQGTGMKFTGSNVVLRNLSFRPGGTWNGQVRTMDGLWLQTRDSIFDHVSVAWASDEGISSSDAVANTTVQYSIAAEGLLDHSYGAIVGPDTPNTAISYHHNLLSSNRSRNPRLGNEVGAVNIADFRNNVIYNWDGACGYAGTDQEGDGNFVGNYYIAGPDTDSDDANVVFVGSTRTTVHQSGNRIDSDRDGVFDGVDRGWSAFINNVSSTNTPLPAPNVHTQTADDALNSVLDFGGANWWNRTSTDARLVSDVRSAGTSGKQIYDPSEVGGWPNEPDVYRPADWDVDGDGMPGYWELEHGLDPNVANHNADFDNDGYTDIEEYINEIAAWPAPQPIVFNAATNNRYAQITNWDIQWQPSKFDEARINSGTVVVDAVGQHAGTILLNNDATLNISAGWLKVEDVGAGLGNGEVVIGDMATLSLSGGELSVGLLSKGAGGSFSFTGGALHADQVDFHLTNNGGTVAPGNSTGQTVINGDYNQADGGTLEIEIVDLADFDTVDVTGTAELGGLVSVILDSSFTLSPTDSFQILTAGTLVDSGLALASGGDNDLFTLDVDTVTGIVTLLASSPGLPGDYNGDGTVDAADYTVWRDTLGSTTDLRANGDDTGASKGVIDAADYAVWMMHFGETANGSQAAGAAGAVPEPATVVLAAMCLLIVGGQRACVRKDRSRSTCGAEF